MQVHTLAKFLDQWRNITSNRFCSILLKVTIFILDSTFCYFKWFNIKADVDQHPIIGKEVDELLAKGVTAPITGGAGFYSNVFVVPRHMCGLQPIFNLR